MKIRIRRFMPIGCLLAAAAVGAAQKPAPVPAPAPAPAVAPVPPVPPAPPYGMPSSDWLDAQAYDAMERAQEIAAQVQDKVQVNIDQKMMLSVQDRMIDVQRQVEEAQKLAQIGQSAGYGVGPGRNASADSLYERGQSALDRRRWDDALSYFNQAATLGGSRADGALYWEAYAANKLGRRPAALAALAELSKKYPSSRWLDDAKALELEVKQANGQSVSPDSQNDEDLKLMALNGLMQSDPDRAIPALQSLLKSAQSPKLKERALYVLAQNNSPKAQQLVEQVARGAGNPDLQVKAIEYLGVTRRRGSDGQQQPVNEQLFTEIYNSTNDVNVKQAILNVLATNKAYDRLLQIMKTEKTPGLRVDAVRRLSSRNANNGDALAGMYCGETDKDVKRAIVDSLYSQNNVKAMVSAARCEKDPDMVKFAVGRIANMKSPEAADYLMEILKK